MDTTVIYYTANRESEAFERKVCDQLLRSMGDLPLISVSQKPMPDFGHNICVGELPWCDASAFNQLLIGLKAANTTFAITAESDCLYPPEYFQFTPERTDRIYRYTNVYLIYSFIGRRNRGKFWRKRYSEGAQMGGRQMWIDRLETVLKDFPPGKTPTPENPMDQVFRTRDKYQWFHEHPVVSFKTLHGLRKWSAVGYSRALDGYKDPTNSADEIPYWGTAHALRNAYQD